MEQTLGQLIEEKREAKELSRKQLAALMGMSPEAVRLYEKDLRKPSRITLRRLSEILEFSTDGVDRSKLSRGRGVAAPPLTVVCAGNPFDGLKIYGPFVSLEEANEWADINIRNQDWWCVDMIGTNRKKV